MNKYLLFLSLKKQTKKKHLVGEKNEIGLRSQFSGISGGHKMWLLITLRKSV